jgi:hypothetical protein
MSEQVGLAATRFTEATRATAAAVRTPRRDIVGNVNTERGGWDEMEGMTICVDRCDGRHGEILMPSVRSHLRFDKTR